MNIVTANDGLIVKVEGALNYQSVPTLNISNRELIKQNQKITFDFSQVTSSDNTGVALLVALAGYAKDIGREVLFTKLPQQLLDLIEANGVNKILPIA